MQIAVSKKSRLPVREQVAAQITFLIATRALKPGDVLPSVRSLARRLGVHHNTVSHAYQELAKEDLLIRRRGSQMVVRRPDERLQQPGRRDLDDLINELIRTAREHGYTLQDVRQRLRERLLEEAPDHILALSTDAGVRVLLQVELREAFRCPVNSCATEELIANPGLAIGALVVCPPGFMPQVMSILPPDRAAMPIIFSQAEEHLENVRRLRQPSIVAVVSVSELVLQIARGVLEPVLSQQHSLCEYLLTESDHRFPAAADLVICDSIAFGLVRSRMKIEKAVLYRLIAPKCLEQISSAMGAHLEQRGETRTEKTGKKTRTGGTFAGNS